MATFDHARTSLLLMDFQNAIVARLDEAERKALIGRVVGLRDRSRAAGVQLSYVRVALNAAESAVVPSRNKMFAEMASTGRLAADTTGAQLIDELVPAEGDIVVRKRRVGAFSTTDLEAQLRALGIDTLLLAGVATSGVVLSTVRDAADKDFAIAVVSDCCGDANRPVHDVLVNEVFPRQADVLTAEEVGFA